MKYFDFFEPGVPIIGHIFHLAGGKYDDIKLNFLEANKLMFRLPLDSKPLKPKINKSQKKEVLDMFNRMDLPVGKTVILCPHANAVDTKIICTDFWNKLSKSLNKKGLTICVNMPRNDLYLENTIPINFPLRMAIQVAETAGYVISIRSGFCDLISSAKSKLNVLYPYDAKFFERFSLKKMNLSDSAFEYEINKYSNEDELIKDIISYNKL